MDTKISKILNYLLQGNSITSIEAFVKFKATRLAAIIYELRKQHKIHTEMIHDKENKCRYAKYHLK
jgi:hypothetical protein